MEQLGRVIIILGVVLILLGLFLRYFSHIKYIGKLPGDIYIKKKDFVFFFPLTSSILISIILSLILTFIFKCIKK